LKLPITPYILWLLSVILASQNVLAQNHATRQFTTDDGLPSSHIYEVKQDKNGFYLISTGSGLVKYDGYTFKTFPMTTGKMYKNVWWSYQDQEDRIWSLGLGTKLWYLDGDTVRHKDLKFEGVKKKAAFAKLVQDNHKYYWLQKGMSFFRFKGDEFTVFKSKELFTDFLTNQCYPPIDKSGQTELISADSNALYFIYKAPISVWKSNEKGTVDLVFSYDEAVSSSNDTSIKQNSADCIRPRQLEFDATTFISRSYDSLYTVFNEQLTGYLNGTTVDLGKFPTKHLMDNKRFRVINLKGKYAFIHPKRSFVTDMYFNHLPEFDLLANYNINTVYEDHEGGIWLSTTEGLIYLTSNALAVRNYPNLMKETPSVSWMLSDKKDPNLKLLGFRNGGLTVFKNEKQNITRFPDPKSEQSNWNLQDIIHIDKYVIALVGNYEIQIYSWDNISKAILTPIKRIQLDHTHYLLKGRDGKLYAAGYSGTYQIELNEAKGFPWSKISNPASFYAFSDKLGNYIIQSTNGLYMLDKRGDSTLISKDFVINKLRWDNHDNPWLISGRTSGVRILKNQTLVPVNSLRGYYIYDLEFEADTVMWAATSDGIVKFLYSEQDSGYNYSLKITMAHGLPTNNVTSLEIDEQNLYAGTSKGLSVIDRNKLSGNVISSRVLLTSVSSKGKKFPLEGFYEMDPDYNSLEFNYVFISPKSNGLVTYLYKLEGIDSDWKKTKETTVNYPYLPAGSYSFQLKALDINNIPSSNTIELDIRVRQLWWKTTWFWVLFSLGSVSLTIGFFLLRLRQLERREKERTQLNNRIAELKLNALQSQMNPHFVFNVLNSIQDYFVNNNVLDGNRYMSDFSKLMRLFLESSDEPYITIGKETKLLSYYIELERMRLDNKFEFEFHIDDNVDPDEFRIPTMILQPILENAILHGIRYKEGIGKLKVSFQLSETNLLTINIEDNGVGRKRSKEINSERRKDHESKASAIIEERIGIINSNPENKIELQYFDLENANGAVGTRVELNMNLNVNS
jgi:ligand-binding sensor domain-containing protein